ncbi:MAG: GTPase, partial [Planctomycetota bacterium]|nr:GTPase [Planctomycetota bacterium]
KSTLLNALSNHATAITSPRAGTTRDVVTADITLDGLDVRLVDTAGWEAETHPGQASIDQLARQKRLDQLAPAALAVWCVSSPEPGIQVAAHLANDRQARQEIRQAGTPMLVLHSRCDLAADDQRELTVEADLSVSTVTGQGMAALQDTLVARLGNDTHAGPSVVGSTAARTSEALRRTEARLAAAAAVTDELLVAVEIREALDQLGAVMGTVYTDEILDQVFSKFCIGK